MTDCETCTIEQYGGRYPPNPAEYVYTALVPTWPKPTLGRTSVCESCGNVIADLLRLHGIEPKPRFSRIPQEEP